jgi:hypothetical protein
VAEQAQSPIPGAQGTPAAKKQCTGIMEKVKELVPGGSGK